MATRTLNWFETEDDARVIQSNQWNIQVAKAVASGSSVKPTYNMVWQSHALAPNTAVEWEVDYALSWTADVPTDGLKIRISGDWQPCDFGDSYDIDAMGYWQRSTTAGDSGWLTVGNIDYSYPHVQGIHIVVGVKNALTDQYNPIFIDEASLPRGSSGSYQPKETVAWWLEASNMTGQVFHKTVSNSTHWDFSTPNDPVANTYEWSTSYIFNSAKWTLIPGKPPQQVTAPPPSAMLSALTLGGERPVEIAFNLCTMMVKFGVPMSSGALNASANWLATRLKQNLKNVKVDPVGKDGTKLKIEFEQPDYPGNFGRASPVDIIKAALLDEQNSQMLPRDETWTVGTDSETSLAADMNGSYDSPMKKGRFALQPQAVM